MPPITGDTLVSLQHIINGKSIPDALRELVAAYPGTVVFSTSFSNEDQVITDLIQQNKIPVSFFTLDTGRLFPETYSTWSRTIEHYNISIKAYYPDAEQLGAFIETNGPNAFYESTDLRSRCCFIRKVGPLKRALNGKSIWITGLRAEHSPNRQQLQTLEWDEANQVIKFHPILHWTSEDVKQYIQKSAIPYNPLHDKGFVSIGCAPCTRAVRPGEDFRAGRWWWEDSSKKECGLHTH